MYQRELAIVVQFQCGHDVCTNISLSKDREARVFQTLPPRGHTLPSPEIGVKEVPPRTQNAVNLREKARKGWITVGRLHVDDCVQGTILEWQSLRVADTKSRASTRYRSRPSATPSATDPHQS
jgi:hypothetical protein